jgi:nickel transport protein
MHSKPLPRSTSWRHRLAAFAVALLWASPGAAHDLWLERDGDEFVLQYGHLHSAHAGEERLAYAPGMVRDVRCTDVHGALRNAPPGATYPVRIPGPCAALHVLVSSGFWSRTVQGLRNQPAAELDGVLRSWESIEGVKRLDRWSEALAAPVSGALELSPLSDPFAVRPGAKLSLLVTLEGAPLAGATVTYDGEPRGVTDSRGQVNIRLRHPGLQLIGAGFEAARDDGRADITIHATLLQFDLPGEQKP